MSSANRAAQAAVICAAAMSGAAPAFAQWRQDQAPVATPQAPATAQPPDVSTPFMRAYQAAGRPRVVLMWNRVLTDEASTASIRRKVIKDSGTSKSGGSVETTSGGAGSAKVDERSSEHSRTRVETEGIVQLREGPRRSALSEREATMLERSFTAALASTGMRFVDRALVMRTTAAAQHRSGGDLQLIETDALLKHGDLIMEVLLVEDKQAPLGYAFDVRTKDLRNGVAVSTLYSRAVPFRPAPQGHWAPGAAGYEFRTPAPAAISITEIGDALARDVMVELGPSLRR